MKEKHCIELLTSKYPQLLMPIEVGIKNSEEYKSVCLRGEFCDRPITFSLNPLDKLEKLSTPFGEIEVLTLRDRNDFVHACQCLGNKCEPVEIPDSTGAMIIFGLNNWEKVRAGLDDYKDGIVLLSSGNYSNVSYIEVNKYTNNELDLNEEQWTNKSIIIRKYHELTHFVMRKKYPDDIDFVRDELIADCVGLVCAFGYFDTRLIKLFLGIENDIYRKGGRLENYEGGSVDNIPKVIDKINELEIRIKKYYGKDVNEIWNNIKELM